MIGGGQSTLVIKICGITSFADAEAAIEAGADMLGFNFYLPSPRYISPGTCQKISAELSNHLYDVVKVGIFVNFEVDQIIKTLDISGLQIAQLSGDESGDVLDCLDGKGYKALRARDITQLEQALQCYRPRPLPPAYLVDAYQPNAYGGTGVTANWSLAMELSRRFPVILAGGLTPENVSRAVEIVKPWGVDVASGVEATPGKKDYGKMRLFIQRARAASAQFCANSTGARFEKLQKGLAL